MATGDHLACVLPIPLTAWASSSISYKYLKQKLRNVHLELLSNNIPLWTETISLSAQAPHSKWYLFRDKKQFHWWYEQKGGKPPNRRFTKGLSYWRGEKNSYNDIREGSIAPRNNYINYSIKKIYKKRISYFGSDINSSYKLYVQFLFDFEANSL